MKENAAVKKKPAANATKSQHPVGDLRGFLWAFKTGTHKTPRPKGAPKYKTAPHWRDPNGGRAIISLQPWNGDILLDSISVDSDWAGTGVAGRAMKWLTTLADQYSVTILLKPFATHHQRLSTKQLKAWYTRLGFRPTRGSDSMVRVPRETQAKKKPVAGKASPKRMKHIEAAATKRLAGTDTVSRILNCAAIARKKVGKKQLTWGDCGQWAWAVVKYVNDPSIDFGLITSVDTHAKTLHELSFHDPDIWHVFLEHKGRLYDALGERDMDDIFALMDGYEDEDDIQEWHEIKPDETVRRLIANDTKWKHDWPFYHQLFTDAGI